MRAIQILRALCLSGLLGCGGGAFLTTIQNLDDGFAARGLRMSQAWIEMRVPEGGLHRELTVQAGECVTAIAVTNERDFVFVEATDRHGPSYNGGSWLVVCSPERESVVELQLVAAPNTPIAFGAYTGRGDLAHEVLTGHFAPGATVPWTTDQTTGSEQTVAVAPTVTVPSAIAVTSRVTPSAMPIIEGTVAEPAGPAIAGTAPPTRMTECSEEVARITYRRGMDAMRTGELTQAVHLLNTAYECHPDGTILFNLAGAMARRGTHAAAREMYQRLLRDFPSLPDARRRQVRNALAQLDRPGSVHVRIQSGDQVFVNNVLTTEVRRGRARARVAGGSHHVTIRARDGSRFETNVNVIAGERVEVDPRRVPE